MLWGKVLAKFGGSGGERKLFPGALALLFALLSIFGPLASHLVQKLKAKPKFSPTVNPKIHREKRSANVIFLAIGLFALIMSFGFTLHLKGLDIPLPYRLFYDYFPGWKGLRAVVRYGVFVLFAVSVLAGLGLAWLISILRFLFRLTD